MCENNRVEIHIDITLLWKGFSVIVGKICLVHRINIATGVCTVTIATHRLHLFRIIIRVVVPVIDREQEF